MKNFAKYIVCAVIALGMTSCIASHFEDNTFCRDAELCLTFTDGSTRAAGDHDGQGNDDTYNEDKLVSAQIFLYPTGGTGSNAVFTFRMANLGDNRFGQVNVKTSISAGQLAQLFPDGATTCDAYVVANYDTDLTMATDTRVATLKATALSTPSFVKTTSIKDRPATLNMSPIQIAEQPSFVMDSEDATVTKTVTKTGTTVTGDIHLTRAASKIRIFVELGEISNNDDTWIPNASAMTVLFRNCSTVGKIDDNSDNAAVEATNLMTPEKAVYFNMTDLGGGTATPGTSAVTRAGSTNKYTTFTPFYSYASRWEEDFKENDAAYLTLNIPWVKASNDAIALYSYDVPINDIMKLERNKYYIVNIKVGVLGDLETIDEATYEYLVLDWKNERIDVSLENPRYLVVNEHNYEMDNVEEILIPYSSSHECEIVEGSLTISQVDLTTGKTKADHGDACTAELVINDGKTYIKVYNDLDNDLYSSGFDFTEYNISVSIQHKGNSAYKETVYITQYPAIYGTACENSDFSDGNDTNDNYGYVWTNGYTYYEAGDDDDPVVTIDNQKVSNFGGSRGYGDSDLKANSMYVISASSVVGTHYIIGDPRTREPENSWKWGTNNNDNTYTTLWYTANNLKGESQAGPQNYYPTDADLKGEDNNPTYNMIAPKFRVCSSYGAISYSQDLRNSYGNVKGRCASYQEDGYPAGRWRLPTKAEFELINVLSNKGLLPSLYVTTMDYWCAHGYGRYTVGATSLTPTFNDPYTSNVSVRCVYDDWYWGSEPVAPKNQFTWGDEPRPTATAK